MNDGDLLQRTQQTVATMIRPPRSGPPSSPSSQAFRISNTAKRQQKRLKTAMYRRTVEGRTSSGNISESSSFTAPHTEKKDYYRNSQFAHDVDIDRVSACSAGAALDWGFESSAWSSATIECNEAASLRAASTFTEAETPCAKNSIDLNDTTATAPIANLEQATVGSSDWNSDTSNAVQTVMTSGRRIVKVEDAQAIIAGAHVSEVEDIIDTEEAFRLRIFCDVQWKLYSREYTRMYHLANVAQQHRAPELLLLQAESHIDHQGKSQRYCTAEILIGDTEIQTDIFTLPKYPSTESVSVIAEVEGASLCELRFVFLGMGCLKLRMPRKLAEHGMDKRSEGDSADEMLEFIGVQTERN